MTRQPPLEGLRVLDLTGAAAGPFGASLLATLGADVIKVDAGGSGDVMLVRPPTQRGVPVGYAFYNRGKRSIVLDLRDEADLAVLYRLADEADVVIDSKRPGVARRLGYDHATLAARNPRLIYVGITAWGTHRELAGLPGSAPLAEWYSGWTSVQGAEGGRGEMDRFGALIDHAVSLAVVDGVLLALAARARSGVGTVVDISLLDTALWMQTTRCAEYLGGNPPGRRGSASGAVAPEQAFRCADGRYLAVAAIRPDQWTRLCEAMGRPDLADDPRFRTNHDRVRNRDRLAQVLGSLFAAQPLDWWDIVLTRSRVPHARFLDWPTLRDHYAVRDTGMLQLQPLGGLGSIVVPDAPWRLTGSRIAAVGAVTPGAHSDRIRAHGWGGGRPFDLAQLDAGPASGPLSGLTLGPASGPAPGSALGPAPGSALGLADPPLAGLVVVELSQGLCGALAARLLSDAGARVIKVEPPDGDYLRTWGQAPEADGRLLFDAANAGKNGLTLDLTDPGDRDRLDGLLAEADVLLTDGSSSAELSFADTAHPGLVHAVARFCRDDRLLPGDLGSELIVQALSETCAGLGEQQAPPVRNGTDVAATCTAMALVGGILAALIARARDGLGGQRVDVDQVSTMLTARATVWATRTDPDDWSGWGPRLYGPPDHGYLAGGGRVVYPFLFRGQAGPFAELLHALGLTSYVDDPRFAEGGRHALGTGRYAHELRPLWEAAFASWDVNELRALFLRHGIVMVPANTYDDLYGPGGLLDQSAVDTVDGLPAARLAPPPWRLNGSAGGTVARPAPAHCPREGPAPAGEPP